MAFEALNEKLKNIGKKNPDFEKKGSGNFGAFFKKNTFMKYLIPIMVLLVVIAVFLAMVFTDDITEDLNAATSPSGATAAAGESVAVLPTNDIIIDTTDKDLADLIKNDPLSVDILADAVYTGCVISEGSYRVGVVQNGGISYQLAVGDNLGASSWEVTEITPTTITFSGGTMTKTLTISN